jgi:hypothetical protein
MQNQDLAGAEELPIADNLEWRQLGPVGLARLYLAMRQRAGSYGHSGGVDLRDEIAKQLGVSGRQLDRYRQLLKLPDALQAAIDGGSLTVSAGLRAIKLTERTRSAIALEIERGASPSKVVAKYLDSPGSYGEFLERQKRYRELLVGVRSSMQALGPRVRDVVGSALDSKEAIAVATQGAKYLATLAREERKKQEKCNANLARALRRMDRHRMPRPRRRAR